MPEYTRIDGRELDELRSVHMLKDIAPKASGSVLMSMGQTQVICAATIEESVPRWMRQQNVAGGWLTAEYSMLPYATDGRSGRESTRGKVGGRTMEIQRLIGRSLRAVIDLEKLGPRTIWLDCDVLQADGGTRTASITGACVACELAIQKLLDRGVLTESPVKEPVAAVSVGVVDEVPLLDLCYEEDVKADVDMNVVMTASGQFVEIQGTGEESTFSRDQLDQLIKLAATGIDSLIAAGRTMMSEA